ncbi:hypothetical protein IE077_001102 [Cardiosporidium cionae]|uniref:Uncharacterized protein n=1 Tax=Cardiosporidium cionae TaxID=476202 RepID=A0ABQ7JGB3_9APIC|nr:hypothetical protein IE077_001102 [Cardiosporidium cionae]|eukprot:KAF8823033.1 hypothetical protein IE077_001102 [Cardiosporidium cionae]
MFEFLSGFAFVLLFCGLQISCASTPLDYVNSPPNQNLLQLEKHNIFVDTSTSNLSTPMLRQNEKVVDTITNAGKEATGKESGHLCNEVKKLTTGMILDYECDKKEYLPEAKNLMQGKVQLSNDHVNKAREVELKLQMRNNTFKIPKPLFPPNGTGIAHVSPVFTETVLQEIRCPNSWVPSGPHCITVISVPPYTTCPGDKENFKRGLRASMSVSEPGICALTSSTGPKLFCPGGFQLEFSNKMQDPVGVTYFVSGKETSNSYDQIGRAYTCKGLDIKPYTSLKGKHCPLGYDATPQGCTALQEIPPLLTCPPGFRLGGEAINSFALKNKMYALCGAVEFYKGKMWCPEGFIHYNTLYAMTTFGHIIDNAAEGRRLSTADVQFERLKANILNYDGSGMQKLQGIFKRKTHKQLGKISEFSSSAIPLHNRQLNETMSKNSIPGGNAMRTLTKENEQLESLKTARTDPLSDMLPTTPSCVQYLAAFAANCDKYTCDSLYLNKLEKDIRNWLYYKLNRDPDEADTIIPNGKNLRVTPRG